MPVKYMIFGAGKDGESACCFFGESRVECFIDNYKAGQNFLGKMVRSLEDVLPEANDYIMIVASEGYYPQITRQLQDSGIKRFFVYREYVKMYMHIVLPGYSFYGRLHYMDYNEIFTNYNIHKYSKIAIYGTNEYICYLLAEISYQNDMNHIIAIVDNEQQQKEIMGIPVFSDMSEIAEQIDCLVINKRRQESKIRDEIEDGQTFDIVDIYDIDRFFPCFYHPELTKYKGIHKGKRAFIIGNGPSLKIEDLEILRQRGEICFGTNLIWKIYKYTEWRAKYLLLSDSNAIKHSWETLKHVEETVFLTDTYHFQDVRKNDTAEYIHMKFSDIEYYPNLPGFSDDITKCVYCGNSITYDVALQLAAYMGFREIYLLGVDHSYSPNIIDAKNHFPGYFNVGDGRTETNEWKQDAVTKAYEKAEHYSRSHGFRIYNATRGRKLDVFERVDFDTLFNLCD